MVLVDVLAMLVVVVAIVVLEDAAAAVVAAAAAATHGAWAPGREGLAHEHSILNSRSMYSLHGWSCSRIS